MSAILLFLATWLTETGTLTGKVAKVADGDTITVIVDRQEIKVRLNAIDAPERGKDFGQKSKDALAGAWLSTSFVNGSLRIISQRSTRNLRGSIRT